MAICRRSDRLQTFATPTKFSDICHARREPIFITKNGYGDLVVMSIETYEAMVENAAIDTAISEAEAEFERDGQLHERKGDACFFKEEALG